MLKFDPENYGPAIPSRAGPTCRAVDSLECPLRNSALVFTTADETAHCKSSGSTSTDAGTERDTNHKAVIELMALHDGS